MLRPLVECFDHLILTRFQDNPRGRSKDELLAIATTIQAELLSANRPAADLQIEPNPDSAWARVANGIGDDELVCIAGSAFLVAELRKTVMDSVESQRRANYTHIQPIRWPIVN